MADFARQLGLAETSVSEDSSTFVTEDGSVIEFCGPAYPVPEHLFEHQDTVIGFQVDDVSAAVDHLEGSGVQLVGDITDGGPVRFQHVRAPDGQIYGLIEVVN